MEVLQQELYTKLVLKPRIPWLNACLRSNLIFFFFSSGDLGHITSTNSPQVEEGDSRFLAREVLHEVKMMRGQ